MDKYLKHYGTPRHSGRYPWGSGESPYQSGGTFLTIVSDLKKQGMSEVDIAKGFGMTTSQLRAQKSLAREVQRKADYAEALRLKDKGYSTMEVARKMGRNESSIRSLLDPAIQERAEITTATTNILKENVEQKLYVDVGLGVEKHLGISRVKLNNALAKLKEEGYNVYYVKVEQLGVPGKYTRVKVLCSPETTYSELYKNQSQIRTVTNWTEDGGRTYLGLRTPLSVSSDRISVRYGNEDGSDKDGIIELRRGVDDLSLGNSRYAQVRIAVDDTHYLKGMAVYSDNLPDGADIVFNTNKSDTGNKLDAMKKMQITKDGIVDPDNPFKATVRQILDEKGEKPISALNIVNEEGDWETWSRNLSSQVLSKQTPALAKKQLDLAYAIKEEEYKDILSLTNLTVKKQLLNKFAEECDSDAVHLKAAALPRQASKVILSIPSLKENEVYAPGFNNGENVVLIRHPHGGTFEIPSLIVNNKSKEARSIMGTDPKDAIGINPKVAEKLSGADFDGDAVIVIPNNKGGATSIRTSPSLEAFDPKIAYPGYDGMPEITPKTKQTQMGLVSNLITDMTIKGASIDEITKAVRHSMVVIDAEKHNLNYKQSAIDNRIAELKTKYQGGPRSGASTLISRAGSEIRVYERGKERIDPETGRRTYEETGETYINKQGKVVRRTMSSTRMAEEEDAFRLSSGTLMESVYATHANKLKALANESRKNSINIKPPGESRSAKEVYKKEVESLKAQLALSLMNKPMERQAQIFANYKVKMGKDANPNLDADDIKKLRNRSLAEARIRVGAKKRQIDISPREWEAIQANAFSNSVLTQILDNTDLDVVRKYATPRTKTGMTTAKLNRAKAMLASGYTQAEVASALGVSTSTLSNALKD